METFNNSAAMPNPALEPLNLFIGEWKTIGTHPMLPGVTLHGQATFTWIEGGAFLMMQSSNTEAKIPTTIAIFASDNTKEELYMLSFDARKVSRKSDVTFKDNVLKWSRTGPEFSQRYSFTFTDDNNTIVSKGEMSEDGRTWKPDLDQTFTRVVGKV